MEKRIIIAGSGGQGILFFGKVLAYAAMIEGREVTCFPSYGAEMRGGTANCTVIISEQSIGSPVIRNPDLLVVMNEASHRRFAEKLVRGGGLFYNSSMVRPIAVRTDALLYAVPAGEIAQSLNRPRSSNMAMLGAFIAATDIIALQSVLDALEQVTPAHRRDQLGVNREIIKKGHALLLHHQPAAPPVGTTQS